MTPAKTRRTAVVMALGARWRVTIEYDDPEVWELIGVESMNGQDVFEYLNRFEREAIEQAVWDSFDEIIASGFDNDNRSLS